MVSYRRGSHERIAKSAYLIGVHKSSYPVTMDEKPIDFTIAAEPVREKPIDLSPMDLSGPIDLTTFRRESVVAEEPPKRLEVSSVHMPEIQKVFQLYSGGITIDTELRPLPVQLSHCYESRSTITVPGPLSPRLEHDTRLTEMSNFRAKLASPMTSPTVFSSPIQQAPTSPTNSLESRSGMQLVLPLLQSPGHGSSMENQGTNKRYMSASRPFNVLAKKLIGDIDCPPRPGHRQGSNFTSGGAGKKDCSESEAAYRERRSKNNLAARRSRDKRKKKCDLLSEKSVVCKLKSLDILEEITILQNSLLKRGFTHPLPFQEEIKFIRKHLRVAS